MPVFIKTSFLSLRHVIQTHKHNFLECETHGWAGKIYVPLQVVSYVKEIYEIEKIVIWHQQL